MPRVHGGESSDKTQWGIVAAIKNMDDGTMSNAALWKKLGTEGWESGSGVEVYADDQNNAELLYCQYVRNDDRTTTGEMAFSTFCAHVTRIRIGDHTEEDIADGIRHIKRRGI